jgi:hypothetical protein
MGKDISDFREIKYHEIPNFQVGENFEAFNVGEE